MTTLTVAGYGIGGLDGFASVSDAASQLKKDPSNKALVATYNAALANAAATITANIAGEGAAFAANAIIANINNLMINGKAMSSNDKLSALTAVVGELITMAGQGVEFYGLSEATVSPLIGGATFTLGQVINAAGFIATAAGAGVDSATIANVAIQQFQAAGLSTSPNVSFTPSSVSSSNFICDADNAATMFNMAVGDNTQKTSLPTITVSPGKIATVVVENAQNQALIISPGLNDSGLNVEVSGSNNDITLKQGAAVMLTSAQTNTIHNDVTGQDFIVSGGKVNGSGSNSASPTDTMNQFAVNADGSLGVTMANGSGIVTGKATFDSHGNLTQNLFYDATSGRLTQENDFNTDGSQVDHIFNANGTQSAYVFNATGHETEYATFGTNGKITQDLFYDATTGRLAQENDFSADGSQIDHIFNANGTQNAIVLNAAGHETEYAAFGANGKMTQDLFYDATSGRLTQENDYNTDGSQVDHIFNANGTQNSIVFNAAGHETEYATYGTNGKKTQDLFFDATSGRETQENDFNADGSQAQHIFNANGTQNAIIFNAAGHETEYATFGTNGKITQDIIFDGTSGRELQETDYNASGGGVAHTFNPDGTQNAAVFDPSGRVSEYATYGTNGKILTDALYDTSGRETQLTEYSSSNTIVHTFNADNSQTATIYNTGGHETEFAKFNSGGQKTDDYFFDASSGRETEYDQYNTDGRMTAHLFNSDNTQNAIIFNGNGQELEYDSFDSSGKLTGFTKYTYGTGGGYDAIAYGPTGYELGWADYGGSGMLISSGGGAYNFTLGDEYGSGADDWDWGWFSYDFGYSSSFGFSF
ncbi:MAG TPA: hypothetical protein VGL08_12440 [Paraburkholderia sp.]|jgi:hypothetical protein